MSLLGVPTKRDRLAGSGGFRTLVDARHRPPSGLAAWGTFGGGSLEIPLDFSAALRHRSGWSTLTRGGGEASSTLTLSFGPDRLPDDHPCQRLDPDGQRQIGVCERRVLTEVKTPRFTRTVGTGVGPATGGRDVHSP